MPLGPNSGTTFADDATVGTIVVSTPANAAASDNAYATATLLATQISHYLKATGFQFQIPLDAVVDGILVEIERSATAASALNDNSVKIVKGGSITGTEKALGASWPNADAYQSYGGATDLWGTTWTPADINDSTFGVVASVTASLASTMQIDHVMATIYYTGSNRINRERRSIKVGQGMSGAE